MKRRWLGLRGVQAFVVLALAALAPAASAQPINPFADWVAVVGMGDRFQIWPKEAFQQHRSAAREAARAGLADLRAAQRSRLTGGA